MNPEILSVGRGLIGITFLLGLGLLLSENRKQVHWKQVLTALFIQMIFAVSIVYVPFVGFCFEWIGKLFIKLMDFTRAGTGFLLGDLVRVDKYGFIFLFQALPAIVFFSAITSLLYYWRIIQRLVKGFAWLLKKILRISGAEGLVAAGNVFLGLAEVPFLVKAYLPKMNKSEVFLIMTAGMSTISAGVLGTSIDLLGGSDPQARLLFAKHLVAASVMAAPGSIVFAKLIIPQTESIDDVLPVSPNLAGSNFLDSLTKGALQGMQVLINVSAILIVFLALVALVNYLLSDWVGKYMGINDWVSSFSGGQFQKLDLQFILGMIFSPVMWMLGVGKEDITLVGSLLGQKMVMNEVVAFFNMKQLIGSGLLTESRSAIMATYLLCGFANFGSIGMQIGAIGSLAPNTKEWLTRYGFRSMLAGTLVSAMSATIVGMLIN